MASLDEILKDPAFASPEAQAAVRRRYFEKNIKNSPGYQRADLESKRGMEEAIFGPGTTAGITETPPPAQPTPTARREPESAPLGNIPLQPAPPEEGMLRSMLKPGGLASPEAQGTAGGGIIGGFMGGPAAPITALIGAGIGGAAGRAYEYLTEPGEAPGGLGSTVAGMGQASQRGMESEALSQIGGNVMSRMGNRMLRPRGPLTQEMAETARLGSQHEVPMRVSAIRDSSRAAKLEELAGSTALGSKAVQRNLRTEAAAQRQAVLNLAEQASPGTKQALSTLGKGSFKQFGTRTKELEGAASKIYTSIKRLVGPGDFKAPMLGSAAKELVTVEQPLETLASPAAGIARPFQPNVPPPPAKRPAGFIQEALEEIDFDPDKTYNFPTLLSMQQRLGDIASRTKNRNQKRQIYQLWNAVGEDMEDAIVTAGVDDVALPLLQKAKGYYTKFIVPVMRDPVLLRNAAKKPSAFVKSYLSPAVPVEDTIIARRALGQTSTQWAGIQRAWYETMAKRAMTETGEFDASKFLTTLSKYDDEQLKVIAGPTYSDLKSLQKLFQKQTINELGGGTKTSLSMGQLMGIIRGVQAAGAVGAAFNPAAGLSTIAVASIPETLGLLLHTPRGIRWMTVGLQAPRGSKASTKAISELIGLAATRPEKEDQGGGFSLSRALGGG